MLKNRSETLSNAKLGNQIFYSLLLIAAILSIVNVLIGTLLFIIGLELEARQIKIIAIAIVPLLSFIIFLSNAFRIYYDILPVKVFFEKPEKELKQSQVAEALTRLINFPILTFRRIALVSIPTALIFLIVLILSFNYLLHFEIKTWQMLISLMIVLIIGPIHGIIQYYIMEIFLKDKVQFVQRFLEKENLDKLNVFSFKIQKTLLIIFNYSFVIPSLALAVTLLVKFQNDMSSLNLDYLDLYIYKLVIWTSVLLFSSFIVSIAISYIFSNQINNPLQKMLNELDNVEKGIYHYLKEWTMIFEFNQLFGKLNSMIYGLKEKEVLKEKFGKYLHHRGILDKILTETSVSKGEKKDVGILYSDIRNFTGLSESLSPRETLQILNTFFAEMFEIVDKHHGIVDKFIGDAFLAVFGAVETDPKQISHAAQAAIEMQKKLKELNQAGKFPGVEIKAGIAIHSGPVIIGNIGSPTRMEYTAVGETVDVALGVEVYTKKLNIPILITETAASRLPQNFKISERANKKDVESFIGESLFELTSD